MNGRKFITLFCIFFIGYTAAFPQSSENNEKKERYLKLRKEFANKKTFSEIYEEPILDALKYYPPLKDVKIDFKDKKIKTSMAARPGFWFFLQKQENRKYVIIFNKESSSSLALNFDDFPPEAKIGIIGHELAHIYDYTGKTNLKLMAIGIKYVTSKKFRREMEHYTDELAINMGLGKYIRSTGEFFFNSEYSTNELIKYKEKYYLHPEEIESLIEDYNKSLLEN